MNIKLAYSLPEAAASTGLSRQTITRAIKAGALKAKRSGAELDAKGNPTGVYVIKARDLEDWIDSMEAA